jgi:hypothetical protein
VLALLIASGGMWRAEGRAAADEEAAAVSPNGDVVQATSCSRADVQVAIDAANDGDVVLVPTGVCTWTVRVDITDKAITLQGAGTGNTIITDATTDHEWDSTYDLIRVTEANGKPFRITGFTLSNGNGPHVIYVGGTAREWRIDHISFISPTDQARAIWVSGYTYGVIDHCTFNRVRGQCIYFRSDNDAWNRPLSLGTANAVYIEDCTFEYIGTGEVSVTDADNGGRFVFRHNRVTNGYYGQHDLQVNYQRGTFSFEVYENEFTDTLGLWQWAFTRGGTGVIFNNTVAGYDIGPWLANYRSCDAHGIWGMCDGDNPIDGNLESNGYPCLDQTGRSYDSDHDGIQDLEPVYEWGNTLNGGDADFFVKTDCQGLHIHENRDYYNDTQRPSYTPYVYPHPLTRDLALSGAPGNATIHLHWNVLAWTYLPPTTTWRIDYYTTTASAPFSATDPFSITRAYTLTDHVINYQWYTVTLHALTDGTPWLSDTVRVMPTDILVYLPLTAKED